MNHLAAFVSLLSTLADWEHHITPKSSTIQYVPTVIPEDDVLVSMRARVAT